MHSAKNLGGSSNSRNAEEMRSGPFTPPEESSRLLALPREIRDIIVKYALTEEKGLFGRCTGSGHLPTARISLACDDSNERESNQLRFVCRQLYHETSGLGPTYNHITLYHPTNWQSCAEFFSKFLKHNCSQRLLNSSLDISIREHVPCSTTLAAPAPGWLRRILRASHEINKINARGTYKIYLDFFSSTLSGYNWVWYGGAMHCALHGSPLKSIGSHGYISKLAIEFLHSLGGSSQTESPPPLPENVRLYPNWEPLDYVTFPRKDYGLIWHKRWEFLGQIQNWFEDGF